MTLREGNLEAPTRHPLDWRNPEFYDEGALFKEMERVFDICHGCRRCVSLCNAFPTLFDLVDESKTMEVDGVAKADYWKVVDQCYLCDVCYMTKCPYVPPHPWNVDFPHLMLRGKAQQVQATADATFRDRLLTSTDRLGKLATIPVVVQMVNKANTHAVDAPDDGEARSASPRRRRCRRTPKTPFRSDARRRRCSGRCATGERTPGKVAIFATCYVNYNEPGHRARPRQGARAQRDSVRAASRRKRAAACRSSSSAISTSVEKLKDVNIPLLAPLARDGYAILTPVPSCTLMFKQELPLMFPGRRRRAGGRATRCSTRSSTSCCATRTGCCKKDFKRPLGKVSYHIPCHSRVQNVGQKTREVLEWVPGHRGQHGRALRRPRRHLGREERVLRGRR